MGSLNNVDSLTGTSCTINTKDILSNSLMYSTTAWGPTIEYNKFYETENVSEKIAEKLWQKKPPEYKIENFDRIFAPKKIIYNDPATIVFWNDGTKTVVKRAKNEKYNKYTAFCAALAKKIFSNNSRVNKIVASGIEQTPCEEKTPEPRKEAKKQNNDIEKRVLDLKRKQHMSVFGIAKKIGITESKVLDILAKAKKKENKK